MLKKSPIITFNSVPMNLAFNFAPVPLCAFMPNLLKQNPNL